MITNSELTKLHNIYIKSGTDNINLPFISIINIISFSIDNILDRLKELEKVKIIYNHKCGIRGEYKIIIVFDSGMEKIHLIQNIYSHLFPLAIEPTFFHIFNLEKENDIIDFLLINEKLDELLTAKSLTTIITNNVLLENVSLCSLVNNLRTQNVFAEFFVKPAVEQLLRYRADNLKNKKILLEED